jgi:hypothetical protein
MLEALEPTVRDLYGFAGQVHCDIDVPDGVVGQLEGDQGTDYVTVDGGRFYLSVSSPSGSATLSLEGYAPVRFTWSGLTDGGIEPCALGEIESVRTTVVGTVTDLGGVAVADAYLSGCGHDARTDAHGAYYFQPTSLTCDLRVGLLLGRVWFVTTVQAEFEEGVENIVDVTFGPDSVEWRREDGYLLGLRWTADRAGLVVEQSPPGGPALGTVFRELDGRAITGLPLASVAEGVTRLGAESPAGL